LFTPHFHWLHLDFFTNIDYFAFGAIPAWWLIKRKDLIKKYGEGLPTHWKTIVISISIAAIITLPQFNDSVRTFMEPIILGPLFASIILFTLPDKKYLKISDQSIFTKLGKYTYGLYLYHTISINFVLQIGKKISFLNALVCSFNIFTFVDYSHQYNFLLYFRKAIFEVEEVFLLGFLNPVGFSGFFIKWFVVGEDTDKGDFVVKTNYKPMVGVLTDFLYSVGLALGLNLLQLVNLICNPL
jgi:hypothetical protein